MSIYNKLTEAKEAILVEALTKEGLDPSNYDLIRKHCIINIFPDKSEDVYYNMKKLIHFESPKVVEIEKNVFNLILQYRIEV